MDGDCGCWVFESDTSVDELQRGFAFAGLLHWMYYYNRNLNKTPDGQLRMWGTTKVP